MSEPDRPAAGIMRHYSRLTGVAFELKGALVELADKMYDDGRVSDAARAASNRASITSSNRPIRLPPEHPADHGRASGPLDRQGNAGADR